MENVRIGIIGVGNMGSSHAKKLVENKVKNGVLTALCDINLERLKWVREKFGEDIKLFDNTNDFFASKAMDAVIVATPHYDHCRLAIEALNNNYHALVEKPAGVYTKQVREMNKVAEESDKVFGIMFNERTNPLYKKVRELVKSGEIGEIKRTSWFMTKWYRSQSYYNSSNWRATWVGEGGGVLLNQCPHELDIWQWICGMPTKVKAFMHFGKWHNIEVEDDVTAYVEYPNGATGVFVASTADTPGTNRLEILGDKGKIIVENNEIKFWKLRISERQFNDEFTGGFGEPECWKCEVPVEGENSQHVGILSNWISAILSGTPLLAPGNEGIFSLKLSNAMHLSSWTDKFVDIDTIDEELFYNLLQEQISKSNFKKSEGNGTVLDVSRSH